MIWMTSVRCRHISGPSPIRVTDTTLKVVAADPNTVSGIKSVGTLIDELWLFGKQYKGGRHAT